VITQKFTSVGVLVILLLILKSCRDMYKPFYAYIICL